MGQRQHLNLKWIWMVNTIHVLHAQVITLIFIVHTVRHARQSFSYMYLNSSTTIPGLFIIQNFEFWLVLLPACSTINTRMPNQNGQYFPDNILKCIFLKENATVEPV